MFWAEDKERLCIECYENKYGGRISRDTLEVTRIKEKCDGCGANKNIVLERFNGYLIFK